jgi:hypothetical protein
MITDGSHPSRITPPPNAIAQLRRLAGGLRKGPEHGRPGADRAIAAFSALGGSSQYPACPVFLNRRGGSLR